MGNDTQIKYANEFVPKLGMDDTKTCVYQFIYNENENDETKIIQYFIMHGLGLLIKVDSHVAHILYARSLIHNTAVEIYTKKKKFFLSLNKTILYFLGDIVFPIK